MFSVEPYGAGPQGGPKTTLHEIAYEAFAIGAIR